MADRRYTVTSLWKGGKYDIRAADEMEADSVVFTSTRGDAIRLSEAGAYTLWEIHGFRLHNAVLPLLRFLDTDGGSACPIAVSDTRLSLLVSKDIAAGQIWAALQARDTEPAHRALP